MPRVLQSAHRIFEIPGYSHPNPEVKMRSLHPPTGLQDLDTLNDSMVALLSPKYWRLHRYQPYAEAVKHDAVITYGLSDHYAWSQGGFPNAKPWLDWDYYEEYILAVMQ